MATSNISVPAGYPAFNPLPEGQDHWFTIEQLASFIRYSQPRDKWYRLERQWPWRWEDSVQKFSAYAVWQRYVQQGREYMLPADFRAYFESLAAMQRAAEALHEQAA